jgi:hypothetical protein
MALKWHITTSVNLAKRIVIINYCKIYLLQDTRVSLRICTSVQC